MRISLTLGDVSPGSDLVGDAFWEGPNGHDSAQVNQLNCFLADWSS